MIEDLPRYYWQIALTNFEITNIKNKTMAWLHRLFNFNRNNFQEQPGANSGESSTANCPKPTSTTVLQVVAEETIMSVAQWLVNLVNRSIQAKPEASVPTDSTATTVVQPAPMMEELLSKFGQLIEQMSEKQQQFMVLENRLRRVEAESMPELVKQMQRTLEKNDELEQKLQTSLQWIDRLHHRLEQAETQNKPAQVEQKLQESLQLIDRLHHRLDQVEAQTEQAQTCLIETFAETLAQTTQPLESRLQQVETAYRQQPRFQQQLQESLELLDRLNERLDQVEAQAAVEPLPPYQESDERAGGAIARSDTQIVQLAAQMQQNDSCREEMERIHQNLAQLEQRMENIEKLLAMFRVVPQLIAENRQGITALQNQLALNQRYQNSTL